MPIARLWIAASGLLPLLVCGCGAPATPPVTEGSTPPAPAASTDASAPTAPPPAAPTAAASSTPAPAEPAKGEAAASPAAAAETPPLSADEKKQMEKRCKPLIQALNAPPKKGAAKPSPAERLHEIFAKPPKMPAGDLETCSKLLERSIRDYQAAMIESEARMIVEMLAKRAIAAYQRNGKLCPAAPPVPAAVDRVLGDPYVSTEADWKAPGWTCIGFDFTGQTQRFQYEIKIAPGDAGFEVIARGSPKGDRKVVEYLQPGGLSGGKLELRPFGRRP